MAASHSGRPIISGFVAFLLFLVSSSSASFPASSSASDGGGNGTRVAFRSGDELLELQRIVAQLARVRNASVKGIQSPDGDVIDCVPMHLQPAFEHPKLRGHKLETEPSEWPRITDVHGVDADAAADDSDEQGLAQEWTRSGESCPEGTIPVRRTTEADVLRAGSAQRFGMKARSSGGFARRDSTGAGHEVKPPPVTVTTSATRGGVRVGRLVLRRQGEPERVAGAGGVADGVQPLPDLGHLRLLRQRPQHHRGRMAGEPSAVRRQQPKVLHILDKRRVPGDWLLQPLLLGLRADQQPRGRRRRHLAHLLLQRPAVRHHHPHLEGPEAGPLVAAAQRRARRLLAVAALRAPRRARRHGSVRRRGGAGGARAAAHARADGQRPLRRGRVRARRLLPQRAGRRLGQQPRTGGGAPAPRRPPRVLRHRRRERRRLGRLLLLWRARQECAVPVATNGMERCSLKRKQQMMIPESIQEIN